MNDILLKIRQTLSPKLKFAALGLIVLMGISALLELFGLGLILPVIAAFADPELLQSNKYLHKLYELLSPSSLNHFILLSAIMLAVFYLLKNLFVGGVLICQSWFATRLCHSIADRIFKNYLLASCEYHLSRNSAELVNNVTRVQSFSGGVIMPLMLVCSEFCVILTVAAALLWVAPLETILSLLMGVFLLFILYFPLQKRIEMSGMRQNLATKNIILMLRQGLSSIKEIKLGNKENFFENEYSKEQGRMNREQMKIFIYGNLPRLALEASAVCFAMLLLVGLLLNGADRGTVVMGASLFAAAMFRLLPSLMRIQYNLLILKGNLHMFNLIYNDLQNIPPEIPETSTPGCPELELKDRIRLEHITFSYDPERLPSVISDFSMEIKALESVALIGATGKGKSTLIDIVMGFLPPQSGRISVDGRDIRENLRSWRRRIGYVPQHIYLFDASVRANIAFGFSRGQVSDENVWRALEMAQLDKFVAGLPEGIDTVIGENGIRLSGGQRQRIAIARALYNDPELLILDEATSALDNDTEKAFIDAIGALKGKLTILMIAHRLSTLENCDRRIEL